MTSLQSGEYWRTRAAATRARIGDGWHRTTTVNLRKVAEEYDRLAERAERAEEWRRAAANSLQPEAFSEGCGG